MVREGHEAGLAHEGGPTNASHREAVAPVVLHDVREVPLLVVDLVRADGLAVDGVAHLQAQARQGLHGPAQHDLARNCAWKGLVQGVEAGRPGAGGPVQPAEDLVADLLAGHGGLPGHLRGRGRGVLVAKGREEVLGLLGAGGDLEGQRAEVVLIWRRHVDLDAPDQDELPRPVVVVHARQELLLHGLEGGVGHRCDGICRGLDALDVLRYLLHEPVLLHVVGVAAGGAAPTAGVVGGEDGATGARLLGLADALVLAQLARLRHCHVRAKENEDVAVLRHVVREGHEAGLAHERRASDAAHREALAPVVLHEACQVSLLIVDLVGADGLPVDRVFRGQAELPKHGQRPPHHHVARDGAGEAPLQGLLHRRAPGRRGVQPGAHVDQRRGARVKVAGHLGIGLGEGRQLHLGLCAAGRSVRTALRSLRGAAGAHG
mmetsp:Transcript_69841/g.204419  ORF Transcript_69841/g.204419 Transcript_69841/m.204419 type:complete len:433 (-) Transcript_69841:65-1363(-)